MLLGITGTDGAGKGTVVDYLVQEKGFTHYSGRAWFLEIIAERGMEPSRESMRLVANELRKNFGNDCIVREYIQRAQESHVVNYIIESIRATAEADTLKHHRGTLLAVDADQMLRYQRIQARKYSSDQVTFEEFKAQEELEMNDPDPNGMQKVKVMQMADYTIMNAGTLEELHQKIETALAEIEARES